MYHDLNNVNFFFYRWAERCGGSTYGGLHGADSRRSQCHGVPVTLDGRNDLSVHGRKVSGNAQSIYKKRILHHGNIAFDVNLMFPGRFA